MPADPSAWTCTCAAAVPLALGLHRRHQTESRGRPSRTVPGVSQALSGSRHEAAFAFLLEAILHESKDLQQPAAADSLDITASALQPQSHQESRQSLISGLYAACAAPACQECLRRLLCTPAEAVAGVCLEVSLAQSCNNACLMIPVFESSAPGIESPRHLWNIVRIDSFRNGSSTS